MKKLVLSTIQTFLLGAAILGLFLFLPAGTLNYWQAWVFIVVFMSSVSAIGLYLSVKDPALLERRKKIGPAAEQSLVQRIIMSVAFLSIAGMLVYCAIDHRLGWTPVPWYVSVAGDVLVALGLFINLVVFRENTFGGSTVEKFEEQKVISTGPYALVRHPMYAGVLVMMVGVPLALGAWGGLAILLVMIPGLVWRILDEEKLLRLELPGYTEYMKTVRSRLVPYVW